VVVVTTLRLTEVNDDVKHENLSSLLRPLFDCCCWMIIYAFVWDMRM